MGLTMSTSLQYGMVAEFLEDLARFAKDELDRLELLEAAVSFRTAGQGFSVQEETGQVAA